MLFGQKQVRDELGIPLQTYRYWAKAVPSLRDRGGRVARLTYGDVLGLAITQRLCAHFGVRVGLVSEALDDLFIQLNATPWIELQGAWVRLTTSKAEIVTTRSIRDGSGEDAILLDCGPIVADVRQRILASKEAEQLPLALGPVRLQKASQAGSMIDG